MHFNLPQPETWERVNDELQRHLKVNAPARVRTFRDLSSAIFEIAQGTAQFLSHKKSVGFITGQTPAFEFLLPFFYKEAFEVQKRSHLQTDSLQAWVEGLKKDTTFVIYCEDHPITGEIFSFCDELDRMLNEKKIFSLRISHSLHLYHAIDVKPFTVRLCEYGDHLAVAICGDRFRSPAVVAPWQTWDGAEALRELQRNQSLAEENREAILSFEGQSDIKPFSWFQINENRLWDRSLISFTDVSAEAMRTRVLAKLAVDVAARPELIGTTNLCHQGAVGLYENWWAPTPPPERLRGLLILSPKILKTKDFAKLVISSYEEIKVLQSWTA